MATTAVDETFSGLRPHNQNNSRTVSSTRRQMQRNVTLENAALDRQWVFPLLTLDVVRPFYNLMGLNQGAQTVCKKRCAPRHWPPGNSWWRRW